MSHLIKKFCQENKLSFQYIIIITIAETAPCKFIISNILSTRFCLFERLASKKILFTPLHIHVTHLYKICSCYSICKFEMLASHFLHNHIWLINSVVKKHMVLPHCPWLITTNAMNLFYNSTLSNYTSSLIP